MRTWILASCALALAACGPAGAPQDTGPAMPEAADPTRLVLNCEFLSQTPADLSERFGAENVTTQTVPGPEGTSYEATVVFPNDATRRVEVVWTDNNARMANATVGSPGSVWTGPHGVAIGTTLADVEAANGKPFSLWGFGWDYGGWVSDWQGGAFAPANNCMTRVRFDSTAAGGAQGDSEFRSDNSAVRAAAPHVSDIGVVYVQPN